MYTDEQQDCTAATLRAMPDGSWLLRYTRTRDTCDAHDVEIEVSIMTTVVAHVDCAPPQEGTTQLLIAIGMVNVHSLHDSDRTLVKIIPTRIHRTHLPTPPLPSATSAITLTSRVRVRAAYNESRAASM